MSWIERAAALWATWRWAVLLGLLCIALAWLNVVQWKRAITAPLRAENAELADTLRRVEQLAAGRNRDDTELLDALDAIAERGQRTRTVYREAATAAPLPTVCAPGQERVNAINRALSGGPTP